MMPGRWMLLPLLFGIAACTIGKETATALYFSESERGAEAFTTRMLITPQYLRIDYGIDADDFILLDRKKPAIYSVNRDDRTILVIDPLPIKLAPPQPFVHDVEKDKAEIPAVGGHQIEHYRLKTNGAQCYDVFAAKGLLPDAVAALREYQLTIAGEHASAMETTPKELQGGCDLANYIFVPARHLDFGFPVRQQDMEGNVRQLVNYQSGFAVDKKLFELPADFRRYHARDQRGTDA